MGNVDSYQNEDKRNINTFTTFACDKWTKENKHRWPIPTLAQIGKVYDECLKDDRYHHLQEFWYESSLKSIWATRYIYKNGWDSATIVPDYLQRENSEVCKRKMKRAVEKARGSEMTDKEYQDFVLRYAQDLAKEHAKEAASLLK